MGETGRFWPETEREGAAPGAENNAEMNDERNLPMSARESLQDKIKRLRPPRVRITYDVDSWCFPERELPFVVGVLGDFVGNPEDALPKFRDRKFIEIDDDNFTAVMMSMKPRLLYVVENKLPDAGSELGVELKFKNIEDFAPDQIVQQVEPLRKLVEARKRLSDLRAKLKDNKKLERLLEDVIFDPEKQRQLNDALGLKIPEKEE